MSIGREAVVAAGSAGRGGVPLPRPETSERNDTYVITPVCSPHVKPLRVIWPGQSATRAGNCPFG